jgi:hypothetical protein
MFYDLGEEGSLTEIGAVRIRERDPAPDLEILAFEESHFASDYR